MPKKNNIKMTAEELIRKHQENQAALAELNKKNLKKACEDIFFLQSMADFAENGILSKINNPDRMMTQAKQWEKNNKDFLKFATMIEMETLAVNVLKLGCKQQETGSLNEEEWEEIEKNADRISEICVAVAKSESFKTFDAHSKKPIVTLIVPKKDGKDLFTVCSMMGSYALSQVCKQNAEVCELNSLVSAVDGRINEFVARSKKEVDKLSKEVDELSGKDKKYRDSKEYKNLLNAEATLYNALQLRKEFTKVYNKGIIANTKQEYGNYANAFVEFVFAHADNNEVGFVKGLPAFQHMMETFSKQAGAKEAEAGNKIAKPDENIVSANKDNIEIKNNDDSFDNEERIENINLDNIGNIKDLEGENVEATILGEKIESGPLVDDNESEMNESGHDLPNTEKSDKQDILQEDVIDDETEQLKKQGFKYIPEYGTYVYVGKQEKLKKEKWVENEAVSLKGLGTSDITAWKMREAIDIDLDKLSLPEKSVALYGMLDGFRTAMKKDLEKMEELLSATQILEDANFNSQIQEGPNDYRQLCTAIKNCKEIVERTNATPDELINAFGELKKKEDKYVRKHTPRFIGHRTEKTAERFKIVQSMSELTAAHNALLKDTVNKLQTNMLNVERQEKHGNLFLNIRNMPLKNIIEQVDNRLSNDYFIDENDEIENIENQSKEDELLDLGRAAMDSAKAKAEKKILTDRFVRKTGLNTEEKRKTFNPYDNINDRIDNAAKNFLANKYLDRIKEMDLPLEDVIDINEQIRVKPFRKELETLSQNLYFRYIVRTYPTEWAEKWARVDAGADKYLEEVKANADRYSGPEGLLQLHSEIDKVFHPGITIDEMLEENTDNDSTIERENEERKLRNRYWDSHTILAEHLLNLAMKKPEYRDVLEMMSRLEEEDHATVCKDVAEYLLNSSYRLPDEEEKLSAALESRVNNSTLLLGVANRVRQFLNTNVFSKSAKKEGPELKTVVKKEGPNAGGKNGIDLNATGEKNGNENTMNHFAIIPKQGHGMGGMS